MRLRNITGYYQAHSSNYTSGRNVPISDFTVHHTAANNTTLRHLWQNPATNVSSTLFVSATLREQYISLNDTPWTNGNFASNSRSITCEVNGDWRNGFYNQATLNNLQEVMYQCLKLYPHLRLTYHNQFVNTICPAELRSKNYALNCWNNAKARIAKESKTVTPKITYKKITPKRIELTKTANLWNFNFTKWADAKAIRSFQKGTVIDVVAEATNPLGAKYYMTAYSYNDGKPRATNGFNIKDTKTHVPPAKPKPAPIDTDPTKPGEGDVVAQINALQAALNKLRELLNIK
jgi:hypothetical protein